MKTAISLKVILILVLLCSCRTDDGRFDVLLQQAETAISSSPRDAMAMLDSINPDELSESRRHYYDLLTIMARDKAYITHTSDSLILEVVDYYSSRKSDPLYPKALYFGGRVYCDLGDYPTALNYFHDALEMLPGDKDENLNFRATVLSQTGRLLAKIRLYSDAIPYIKEAIRINGVVRDTFGLAHNNRLLSDVYVHKNNLDSAYLYNSDALKLSSILPETDKTALKVDMAYILYGKGLVDSALTMIRPLPAMVDPMSRNYTIAIASKIYHDAGILDTAYIYAHELTGSNSSADRKAGLQMLLSPEMRPTVPKDSLFLYIPRYKRMIDDHLNRHDAEDALIQNSQYNYEVHLREREKAENTASRLFICLSVISIIAAVAIAVGVYLKMTYQKKSISPQIIVPDLNETDIESLQQEEQRPVHEEDVSERIADPEAIAKANALRDELLDKLKEYDDTLPPVNEAILQSTIYRKLMTSIDTNKSISEDNPFWANLEELIKSISPEFKTKLTVLTCSNLSITDFRTALLIRCGITPSQLTIILRRTKTTVSSRRGRLLSKILRDNSDKKSIDAIIRII